MWPALDRRTNRFKDFIARICLAEIPGTPDGERFGSRVRIIMCCDKNDRCVQPLADEMFLQFNSGHSVQLHVEDEAVKLTLLPILENLFRGGISNRLKSGRSQKPAE